MGGRSGWMREGGGAGAQVWKGGCTKHCEGQVVGGGGLEGAGTRGNENVRRQQPQTKHCEASEGQSANGGEGGSKTCGRHVDGSGAEAGKESTTRRQAGVGLSTHGGVGDQGLLGTLTSSMREGGVGAQWGGKHCEGYGVRHGKR